MRKIYFILVFVLPFLGFGQCPTDGSIFLTSQAEVNAFAVNYPSCSVFNLSLSISGNDITDLTPLSGLTEVRSLSIINNPLLLNLNGLNLTNLYGGFFGYLRISDNLALQDISALASIVEPVIENAVMNISNNPQLTSLNGLQGINSFIFESITINNNDSLTNLSGLEGIEDVLVFIIANNDNLVNFSGLDNLESVVDRFTIENNSSLVSFVGLENINIGSLYDLDIRDNLILSDISQFNGSLGLTLEITNNPNLSFCSTTPVCDYLDNPSLNLANVSISNNAVGCNTYLQVEDLCDNPCPSEGSLFFTTQAEINAFGLNYPYCSEFSLSVFISGNDITDLSPLSGLTEVRSLSITNNPSLLNLNGLNLTNLYGGFVGYLTISDNLALQDISALASIVEPASGYLVLNISNNPQLTSLNGLQGINSTSTFESISIVNNDSLTNLSGLEGIEDVLVLIISNNDNLINFSGLDNLESVIDRFTIENNSNLVSFVGLENISSNLYDLEIKNNMILSDISQFNGSLGFALEITNNPNLSFCSTSSVCDYLNDPTFSISAVAISNNAEGCNSYSQVANACNSVPINDECEAAIVMELSETIEAYSEFGTQSLQTPSCNDINRIDVWFTFNLDTSILVDIVVDSPYNLQLWEGDCSSSLIQIENACAASIIEDIAISANTNYYLQVWSNDSAGATGLFNLTIKDATLSLEDDIFESFSIHPNPVNSLLTFSANDNIETITVYNLLGQNIINSNPKTTQGELDVSTLSSGLYIVKVGIANVFESFRIVKN